MHLYRKEGSLMQCLILDATAHTVVSECVWLLALSGISVERFLYYRFII